jgi:PAS domain S-box-containing protein
VPEVVSISAEELQKLRERAKKLASQRESAEKELRAAKRDLEVEVEERTRALTVLSQVNQVLMHASDEGQLLQDVCETAVKVGGYRLAWVGFVEHDKTKSIRPIAWAGAEADYLASIDVSWGPGPKGRGPGGRSIRTRKPVVARDILHDPKFGPWRDEAIKRGYESSISLPLLDAAGTPIGAIALYADRPDAFSAKETELLTELAGDLAFGIGVLRGRAAQALAEKEAHEAASYTRAVIESSLDAIVTVGLDGKIADVNQAAQQALGVPRDRLIGSDFAAPFTDPELAWEGFRKVLQEGYARNYPLTVKGSDGELIDVLFNATVYRDAEGEVQGVLTVARDVTEWKKAQAQAARLAAIVTASQDAIFCWDVHGIITSWNPAAETLYGYSADEILGKDVSVLAPPDRADEPRWLISRILHGGRVAAYETRRMRKDDSVFDVSLTLSPIRDEAGSIVDISVIGQDITRRKQAEAEHAARLRFVEIMDRVNRAIQGADTLEHMMSDVLDLMLEVFDCDRAYLLYPCDPDSATWSVPMERTRPEYPGLEALGIEMPMDADVAQTLRTLLDAHEPVAFGPGTEHPLPEDVSARFGFKAFLSMALYPRVGRPWQFGLHQCRYARIWTDEDASLLAEVGRRLEDALTSLLAFREVKRSEAAYRQLVDTANEGIWAIGPVMNATLVNARMADMLGYSADEMIGKPVTDFMFEEDVGDHQAKMEHRRLGAPEEYERRLRRKDGSAIWTHISAAPIFDDKQQFAGTFAMITDITDRRRMEQDLSSREREYRTVLESVPDFIVRYDRDLRRIYVNRAWEKASGLAAEDVLNVPAADTLNVRDSYLETIRRVFETGTADELEFTWENAEGKTLYLDYALVPERDELGEVVSVLAVGHDLTDRREAEAELRASEEKFAAAFHASPDLVAITRLADGVILEVNEGYARMLGYSRGESVGRKTSELAIWADPSDRDRFIAVLQGSGVVRDFETSLRRKDGTTVAVVDSAQRFEFEGQECILSIAHDISERKRMEEITQARLRIEEYANTHSLAEVLTATLDEVEALTGSTIGFYHFLEPDQRTLSLQAWSTNTTQNMCTAEGAGSHNPVDKAGVWMDCVRERRTVIHNDYASLPHRRGMPEGHAPVIREVVTPVFRGDKIVAILGVGNKPIEYGDEDAKTVSSLADMAWDIAERKIAEQALRASERKLALHLQQTLLGVIEFDTDFKIREWNPAAEAIFGYSRQEVLGKSALELVVPRAARPEVAEVFETLLKRKGGEFGSNENITKDGTVITCEWVNTPLLDDGGNVTGVMSLARDVTERVQAEEYRIAKQAAEAANVAKSAFLANMSHEIRTPMNAILGFSQLMRHDKALTERQRQQLDIINSSGEHLLALINDVLEMSKIEAGRITANLVAFDLHELIDEMESLFAMRAQAKGLELRVTCSPDVPRFVVTDENKLRQVFVNLLGNAIKFTTEGSVDLRVDCERDGNGKLRLVAEVHDTGRGIPQADMGRLFEYFEQAEFSREGETGTGLGLAISREFVRLLGGEITAESEVGVGSTFKFDIVIEPAESQAVPSAPEESRIVGIEPGQPSYRVLVADDDPDNRELLVQIMERVGFSVRAAQNGQEAVAEYEEWHPQLILMDMRMPVMDGYEATRRIRSSAAGSDVAIVGVTASAFAEMRQGVFDAGVDEFVLKPLNEAELLEKAGKLLGVRYAYEEPEEHERGPAEVLDSEALVRLPAGLLSRLKEAATAADFDVVLELADEAANLDARVGDALRALAERYDADAILAALPGGEDQ